ncbi:hypothetical protein A3I51_04830 [Candidatus Gottesmanbacteria bacterium RIFCSPLOWO2_02_FULL_38_8]|uniref:Cohesin domain-containing protein n=1 Tax=Candidatus Gottesmanbacteria bacterium RIFCSPLOWO2_02_FULL_38_8 TaxID=1798397 RepID=A0A1F6B1U9_9BACT|nr:MAG: hypothetical protein A3I51_04830 [Candidatus Gottesmanbacteria bacterium RIFCSPLOWO2_02_FULL_38_8]
MIKKIFILLAVPLFLLIIPQKLMAASISLSDPSSDILSEVNQEFEITVNLSINAADGTKYYLRSVFFKSGTNRYCGYTWSGQNWYNGPFSSNDGWKNLPSIIISSDSAQTRVKSKLDPLDNDCNSSGEYFFKVERYTQGGSGSFDDQNEQKIIVDIKAPTITVKPTLIKTPTATSGFKSKSDPIIVAPSITVSPTLAVIVINSSSISSILSSEFAISDSITASADVDLSTVAGLAGRRIGNLTYLTLIIGISLIFAAAFWSFKKINNFRN